MVSPAMDQKEGGDEDVSVSEQVRGGRRESSNRTPVVMATVSVWMVLGRVTG
jgi:hypothetical protein